MISLTPSSNKSSKSPSNRLCSLISTVENLSSACISAAVSTTPRRHPAAHTKISCTCGISIPVCTIFQVPLAGVAYSRPDAKGDGNFASAILIPSSFRTMGSFTLFNIHSPHRFLRFPSPASDTLRPFHCQETLLPLFFLNLQLPEPYHFG